MMDFKKINKIPEMTNCTSVWTLKIYCIYISWNLLQNTLYYQGGYIYGRIEKREDELAYHNQDFMIKSLL